MNIAIIGTGYVGLTTGVCLASKGHQVTCVDLDQEKINMINSGTPPIFEEGMKELLEEVISAGLLIATIDSENAIKHAEIIFLCVGTPSKDDGSINLEYLKKAANTIAEKAGNHKIVVIKSTVVPGTTMNAVKPILDASGINHGLCMNPEFLKEGAAIKDFLEGDRVVLGVTDKETETIMRELYKDFPQQLFITNPTTAEMIKYANNSLLATKISFANELGNLCKKLGIDSYEVMDGVGLDKRLSRQFLNCGAGFGGSCFPKDVKAIISKGLEEGEGMKLLKTVIEVNNEQPVKMIKLLEKHANPVNKKIGIIGLAFKQGTDDVREAPSIAIINELLKMNSDITVYDPEAMSNAKKIFSDKIKYAESARECANKSDAILILTGWDEFRKPELYSNKIVIDGRRIKEAEQNAKIYEGICW